VPVSVQPVLLTRDLERLRRFYVDLLDATESRRVPDEGTPFYVGLRLGEGELGITAIPDTPPDSPGRVLLSIGVDDVDALIPKVEALGGHVTGGPNDMPWGQRVVHLTDPDGNLVNLTQEL
jgi:predicted enzyme related to lactoylglutathione lyase